ncbi:uncharacterized protein LOC106153029 [Lingula anatina]|uniref:Uncharacterized protein LOC106153029 n=1 Tax=Lingula anatina TaxID=7574 RepID=A0A2R2MSI6_LINAN|nr:uncharacterized protein LOC106153029 [Lingula anatina]|eukprot:XP_023933230.1 uncharacterized protein LOC106153029 [Lingula anatina]
MKIFIILSLVLLESQGSSAVDCVSCLYLESDQDISVLKLIYREHMDSRCADSPTSINETVPCPGSCIFSRVTGNIYRAQDSPVTITYRGCSPVASQNEGCSSVSSDPKDSNTTSPGQKSLQEILDYTLKGGYAIKIMGNLNGSICACNSDSCNGQDLSTPVVQVPETQCHECMWMEYNSSDPESQRQYDQINPASAGLDVECVNDTANTPLVQCAGSCLVLEFKANMSINKYPKPEENLEITMIKRQCAGLHLRDQIQTLSDKDGLSFFQFVPKSIKSLKQRAGAYFNAELTWRTCNKDGCNEGDVLTSEQKTSAAHGYNVRSIVRELTRVLALVIVTALFWK